MGRLDQEIMSSFYSALMKGGNAANELRSGGAGETVANLLDALGGGTALTHSKNAYGGDEDMAAIKKGGTVKGLVPGIGKQYGPATQTDPQDVLTAELTAQAASFQKEASGRIPSAIAMAEQLATQNQLRGGDTSPGNADLNAVLKEQVGRLPPGERYTRTSSNVIQEVDPSTGETIVSVTRPRTYTSPGKVIQTNIQTQGQADIGFNLDKEMSKMKMLSGTALMEHVSNTMVNIDVMISKEMANIRRMAAQESGYAASQAALQSNMLADETSGFVTQFGKASAQTLQARQQMTAALSASQMLERSLAVENSTIARLSASKAALAKIEVQRAQQDVRSQTAKDAKQEKLDLVRSTVTASELANYRIVFGDSGDDERDATTIAMRRDRDPYMKAVLGITSDTIGAAILSTDAKVKDAALKLALQYEKDAPGSTVPKDAIETPLTKMLRKISANPSDLIKLIPDKERRKEVEQQLMRAQGKERSELRATLLPDLLGRYIETETERQYLGDTRTWKSFLVTDPNSPLAKTIANVSSAHPTSLAPSSTVVHQFINTKHQDAEGKIIPFSTKVQMLTQAATESANALSRNLLITNDSIESMRIRSINAIKAEAGRAFIRGFILEQNIGLPEREEGFNYMNSKEFRKKVTQ